MNNLPPGADNDNSAPFNEIEEEYCPICATELDEVDSGYYKDKVWINYKCSFCTYELINEPDSDN